MKSVVGRMSLLCALALGACASQGEAPKLDDAVSALVLPDVPTDVQTRTLVDFGGDVHLVGWDLSPSDKAAPGSTLHLKLYWRSVKKLSPGWTLFTHVIVADAPKPYSFDDVGVLRQKLEPSDWVPGNVYVDEQDITVPNTQSPSFTLAVGLGHEAVQDPSNEVQGFFGSRLEILSGLSDGHDRAIIAQLATGVTPSDKAAPARTDKRRGMTPTLKGRMPARPAGNDPKEKP
ncbi:MAG TPA: hypothetical protein VMI54_25440 [Polyangiaceae bacterium]|nr:hypothetical protein [Polyangiaceae bacterium]